MIGNWIESMRLRTLPVSVAGVIAGCACSILMESFRLIPALLCLVFAVLAQIAANFGNEYYDFKHGIDKKGREGFRRGVTEGEIAPESMKTATFVTLAAAAAVGCAMLCYGPWWLVLVGIVIILFALAYSAGPYPLSHHGLGDVAVVIFFGVIPVTLTYYLQSSLWIPLQIVLTTSVSIGLLAANVLIVNNYRDMDDDKAVGKNTTVVLFGRKVMGNAYLFSGILAMTLMLPLWLSLPVWSFLLPATYMILHYCTWRKLVTCKGSTLNPVLGRTASNMLLFSLMLLAVSIVVMAI